MRLLLDANLSRRLLRALADIYPEATHVSSTDLHEAPDIEIWNFAKREDYTVVTTDGYFLNLSTLFGPPPKVILLRSWTHPTRDAARVLRREAIRIGEFIALRDAGTLILHL